MRAADERTVTEAGPTLPIAERAPPERIGPWRVLRELGRGGMGWVGLAERADGLFEQQVAIKILRGDLQKPAAITRFERERRILAQLEAPGIARLIDGGALPDGAPYLVMERIDGEPLDAYCRRLGLSIRQRVELFLQVCAAVALAHRHLVVHRDLKPSNVLVTAEGQVKLVDFGIAKLLDGTTEPESHSDFDFPPTEMTGDSLIMTPAYASPEQILGQSITTASDVYSLGVVLYELLTGTRPYGQPGFSLMQQAAAVLNETPKLPSAVVGDRVRSRELAGDLDAILLRCLAKKASERYPSVETLQSDLRRFLDHRTVSARPHAPLHGAALFVRRNRWGAAMATLVAVLVAATTVFSVIQAKRLEAERDRADLERERASAVADFLVDLFKIPDPSRGRAVTAEQILDRGAARIDDPRTPAAIRANLFYTIGETYRSLGLAEKSQEILRRNLESLRRDHRSPLLMAQTATAYALALDQGGDFAAADAAVTQALELARQSGDRAVIAAALNARGIVAWSRGANDEAERMFRETLEIRRSLSGAKNAEGALMALSNLGLLLDGRGQHREAEPLLRESLAEHRRLFGEHHPSTATSLNNLAACVGRQQRWVEAEDMFRQTLALRRELLGDSHHQVSSTWTNLAIAASRNGKFAEARAAIRESLRILEHNFGPDNPRLINAYNTSSELANLAKDYPAALADAQRALELANRHLRPDHAQRAEVLADLAETLAGLGRFAEAHETLASALAIQHRVLGPDSLGLAESRDIQRRIELAEKNAEKSAEKNAGKNAEKSAEKSAGKSR